LRQVALYENPLCCIAKISVNWFVVNLLSPTQGGKGGGMGRKFDVDTKRNNISFTLILKDKKELLF
jgi:hypothetical protein